MAKFEGDVVDGKTLTANSMMTNLWYDIVFQEDKNVWKNRNELESYFRMMMYVGIALAVAGAVMMSSPVGWVLIAVGVVLAVIKYRLLKSSEKKTDHR